MAGGLILHVLVLLAGLSVGSFANTCFYRIPRGISLWRPRSFCPSCRAPIPYGHLIPLVSYLLLRARCRACGAGIPATVPLVEALFGGLALLCFRIYGPSVDFVFHFFLLSLLAIIFVMDLRWQVIPTALLLPGVAGGLLYSSLWGELGPVGSLLGAGVGGGAYLALKEGYRAVRGHEGLGMGDVKMAAMVGAFLGMRGVLYVSLYGSLLGLMVGVTLIISGRAGLRTPLPYGSFLAAGSFIYVLSETIP